MMSFFNPELDIPCKEKKSPPHPWEKIIKHAFMRTYKYAHNSAKNPTYPPPKKGRVPSEHRMKFTLVGPRTSKEFIYCAKLINGLHKYRWRHFDTPTITGVTSVEWPSVLNELKIRYGGELYCLESPVAIFINDEFLGGINELKELIKSKYIYYIHPDYYVEAIDQFATFMKGTNRPFAHLDIFIDGTYAGAMVFMLFSDIVPRTCDNFLKRCQEKKGGYSGTPVHRVVKDGWIQCGGFGLKETDLDCENFIAPPDRRGAIAMANDGRNVDCSTQFFVLLQPQDWMAFKYVFFGQLVIGDETMKKIEQVPTWYESPKADIIISKASILNLQCHDIKINKGINKYIESHTEDLIIIGEMFYEALLDKVFLEVQLRSLQRIQDEMIVCEGEGISEEIITKNLQTTQRFMRKKEEIERQIEKSSAKTTPAVTISARSEAATPAPADKGENNDFDVEEYEYTPEEYSYQHVTAYHVSESDIKPERPYYIPLTDVPYPGEVSSEYDLKRLLQGDYCFQADLDKDLGKPKKKTPEEENLIKHSEVLDELLASRSAALKTATDSEMSFDFVDDDDDIKGYLEEFADSVSFTGKVVRKMAISDRYDILDTHEKRTNVVPDEALRQYRMTEYELRRGLEKKVSISTPPPEPSEIRKEINRRQTGFVRPEDLTRMRQFERHDDSTSEDDELDDYLPYTRQVSIQHPHSLTSYKKLMAQPSTRPDEKLTINSKISYYEPPERQKSKKEGMERLFASVSTMDRQDGRKRGKESQAVGVGWNLESSMHMPRFSDVSGRRMSVLGKLMDDVVTDQGPGPILKDYQPFSEKQNKTLFLLTYSPEKHEVLKQKSDTSREIYLRRRHSIASDDFQRKPLDQILLLQHGKRVYRKISTDYVKTINHIEKKAETSLRSLEYAKYRPAISIRAYQKKNKEYRESLMKQSTMSNDLRIEDGKEKKAGKKRSDRKLRE